MFNKLKRLFSNRFIEWDIYKSKIDFLDEFNFQQQTRKESIVNSPLIKED